MECPNCKLLSFIGEWLTPKETQGMATRPCVECNEEIDTAFLVQPREKKRGKMGSGTPFTQKVLNMSVCITTHLSKSIYRVLKTTTLMWKKNNLRA